MRLSKILTGAMVGAMLLTVSTPAINNLADISTVEAAKGGAKLSIPKSAPKVNLNKTPSTSNTTKTPTAPNSSKEPAASSNSTNSVAGESKAVSGNNKEYKPSKNAKELTNGAPTAKSATTTTPNANAKANTNTGTGFGNTLRNIGLFAGGMMLGGLIGSLLGDFGGGLLGDVLGLIFNLAIFYALYRGGRYLWDKCKGNRQSQNKIEDRQPIDITPPQASDYPNKLTIGMDYEAKKAADYYRQL